MDRRSFVGFGAVSLAALAAPGGPGGTADPGRLGTLLGGTRVDAEFVAWLESGGHGLAALPAEQRGRSARLLDAQLATVRTLIATGRYDEPTGRRLHRLAASLATTSGWYRFDQGRHPAAGRRWELALQSAHRAGDRERAAGVLADAAYQATWLGRPAAAADRLDYALTTTLHPTARALLLLRRARAHAARHDPAACRHDLAAAERALATPSPDPAPAWCAWMGPADLAVDSGGCLLDLGHPAAARTRIAEGLARLPPARAKTRGVFLAYQARTHLRTGEVEQALAATAESLDLAARIGSPRCAALVRGLAPAFGPYRRQAGVPELLERIGAAGATRVG
ncbi:XRE family transcriptional regulator [Kitasatospora sp. NPDC088783]|uniref:XRE family transcriptional regulator n=1 Tax=Kitasatospora sp. NPDC088783 TaxID=3364077 RepID=UPI003825D054